MKKSFYQSLVFMSSLFLISSFAIAAGNSTVGKTKSQPCAACHQADGNSAAAIYPKLAGQNALYLVKQLQDFKKGTEGGRNNAIMYGMVANLSEQDMVDLAAYYASQKTTIGKTEAQYLELGQKIYNGGLLEKGVMACAGCHSANGQGNIQAHYPALSGQHAEYVIAQLQAFRSGQRHNDTNGIMGSIAKKMSDDEIKAVANYIQGLH